MFMLVFLVTDDRCEQGYNALEKFTQVIQTKYICNDPNAKNKYTGKLGENQVIDNSYCSYENNVVCNRPFADNYDNNLDNINKNNISSDISVCGSSDYNNYIDVFEYDEDNNKIRAIRSDTSSTPGSLKYLGKDVTIDSSDTRDVINDEKFLKYKNENTVVYKQTNKIDN